MCMYAGGITECWLGMTQCNYSPEKWPGYKSDHPVHSSEAFHRLRVLTPHVFTSRFEIMRYFGLTRGDVKREVRVQWERNVENNCSDIAS